MKGRALQKQNRTDGGQYEHVANLADRLKTKNYCKRKLCTDCLIMPGIMHITFWGHMAEIYYFHILGKSF